MAAVPISLAHSFRDPDHLSEALRGWNLDFVQLDPGPFEADLFQVTGSSSQLTRARFNRTLEQCGISPDGVRTLAVLDAASSPVVWRNQRVSPDSVIVFPTGGELDAVSAPGFSVYTVSFSEATLSRVAKTMGVADPTVSSEAGGVIQCGPRGLARLRGWLDRFSRELRSGKGTESRLAQEFELEYPRRVLEAICPQSRIRHSMLSATKAKALRAAREFIAAHPGEPLTVSELCGAAGVSERTLQYAFRDRFGVSPKAYLRDLRLNRVRSALLQADPGTETVARLANDWGFWHMGQFALDYRRMFGELPAETLSQRPGRA